MMPAFLQHKQVDWIGQTLVWPRKDDSWNEQRLVQFERYSDWCEAVSVKLSNRLNIIGVEPLDFIHYGAVGLLEAVDNYDPGYGVPFKLFAYNRVRGSIYNSVFRYTEKATIQNWQRARIDERLSSLVNHNSNESSDAAEILVTTILDAAVGLLVEQSLVDDICLLKGEEYFPLEFEQLQASLVDKIQYLPSRERSIMTMHYIEFMSFTSIAQELNISKGRVSQLHKRGIDALRRQIIG